MDAPAPRARWPPPSLAGLPDDLWMRVASFLDDPRDLLSLCAVCRRLRKIGSSAPLWRAICAQTWPAWTAAQLDVLDTRHFNWKLAFARRCKLAARDRRRKTIAPPLPPDAVVRHTCAGCRRPPNACFCAALPAQRIDNSACPVLVLQDSKTQVSIGTVQILELCLTHCTVINDRDFSEGKHPALDAVLASGRAYLLFPSHRAHTVVECHNELASAGVSLSSEHDPIYLVAIDGSWRTAKAIYRWHPRIAHGTRPVQITETEPSVFGELKREPKGHFLSTMEAVAKALGGLVVGDERAYLRTLMPVLRRIVDIQQHYARGAGGASEAGASTPPPDSPS